MRVIRERGASPHTIAAYRDTLKLLLAFASKRLRSQPCRLDIGDLDAPLIAAFLDHLERERANSVRTRNARLAAIHSLFRYAALRHPEYLHDIERVLAIPPKRSDRALVTFLDEHEIDALLTAPDRTTWTGRRDHAMLLTAIQTGLRASELTGLNCGDLHVAARPHLSCRGKGRLCRIRHSPPYVAPGTMSQAGFDGGSISRTICPWVRRTSADVTTEEVPPGID